MPSPNVSTAPFDNSLAAAPTTTAPIIINDFAANPNQTASANLTLAGFDNVTLVGGNNSTLLGDRTAADQLLLAEQNALSGGGVAQWRNAETPVSSRPSIRVRIWLVPSGIGSIRMSR